MGPRLRGDDNGGDCGVLFTIKEYSNSEILLDFTFSVVILSSSRSKYEGRLPEAFCRRGTGAAPASEGHATFVPGPCAGSPVGHYDPARSDHGQTPKGKDAALARRKARGVTLHAQSPAIRARPGATHSRTGLA